ncbi:methanogenesis marker protein Mmp4/MtxX [Methanoregula formicica]|uniref:Putative methanogen marker protein 4 n=1 Tax=Methanoregula formicica (strain DSM 22288 / NBRC 105244 / SMSP) TaxID=593750 RepID=L0HJ31_METFS|nr:methanogenesis marker protein Mmp4/MtxX [Methanoregula formicica]AGB03313.1 putative methanogen marker protein 4 [Methanoregula formicica SMSP]
MPVAVKRVGIGIFEDPEKVIESAVAVCTSMEISCYCRPGIVKDKPSERSVHILESAHPEQAMIDDLMNGSIDAAVRGTLPANATLKALKIAEGVDHLERIALLETAGGKKFLLTPVGVDEGWTVPEKLELIKKGKIIAKKFGLPEKTGILSGGRLGDIGRHKQVDASMAEAELVAKLSDSVHCEILIEDAIQTCGLIIAPDGISGNLIFRTLTFLGNGYGHGAPVVNIRRIFVDSSRASPNYANALLLAASLLE